MPIVDVFYSPKVIAERKRGRGAEEPLEQLRKTLPVTSQSMQIPVPNSDMHSFHYCFLNVEDFEARFLVREINDLEDYCAKIKK